MTGASLAPAAEELTTEYLVAGADRRFYAFLLDRFVAWALLAVALYASYTLLVEPGDLWSGVAAVAGAVLLVGLAGSVLVGVFGLTPGKALLGLRVLSVRTARPVGVPRAALRTLILGVA